MTIFYRDRMLRPMNREDACELLEDLAKRTVGQEVIGPVRVSTVHLVVGHPCSGQADGSPCPNSDGSGWSMDAYFETLTFSTEGGDAPDDLHLSRRYHTLLEAVRGHEEVCTVVRSIVDNLGDALEGFKWVK